MQAGDRIGGYRVVRLLGAGGMGEVYEAHNDAIGRRVAIKTLDAGMAADTQILTRFLTEARLANHVSHPGLMTIHEFGRLPAGGAFLVMEFLDGQTLEARLEKSPDHRLPPQEVIRLGLQVADALAAVHSVDVVHRDIKPANLMLLPDAAVLGGLRVKILDFGLAKDRSPEPNDARPGTKRGVGMGTPTYMAPEQIFAASSVDDRADIYALGVTLFEMLAGRPPFVEADQQKLLGAHIAKPAPNVRSLRPDVHPRLAGLIAQLLEKSPEARPTAQQVVVVLSGLLPTPPGEFPTATLSSRQLQLHRKPWPARLVALLAACAGLCVIGGLILRVQSPASTPTQQIRPPAAPASLPTSPTAVTAAPVRVVPQLGPPPVPPPSPPASTRLMQQAPARTDGIGSKLQRKPGLADAAGSSPRPASVAPAAASKAKPPSGSPHVLRREDVRPLD